MLLFKKIIFASLFLISACGFSPIYTDQNPTKLTGKISIQKPKTQNEFVFYSNLVDRFGDGIGDYILNYAITTSKKDSALNFDGTSHRVEISGSATFSLKEKESGIELLSDKEHWGRATDMPWLRRNMDLMWFMIDYMNEKVIDEDPMRLVPYQCWYEHNPSPFQFTIDVFLNTEKECFGGINIWNFAGKTSIVEDIKNMYTDKNKFDIRKDIYNSKFTWAREMTFGMKYNRAVILPADILKSDILDTAHFTDCDRMAQKLFL